MGPVSDERTVQCSIVASHSPAVWPIAWSGGRRSAGSSWTLRLRDLVRRRCDRLKHVPGVSEIQALPGNLKFLKTGFNDLHVGRPR